MPASVTIVHGEKETTFRSIYTGEQIPLVLHATTRQGEPVDMSDSDLYLDMESDSASISKEPDDFTCPYDDDDSMCSVQIGQEDTEHAGSYEGRLTIESSDQSTITKSDSLVLVVMSTDVALSLGEIRYELESAVDYDETFSVDLLALARQKAVDDWNSQPGRHRSYTVENFPERFVGSWKIGAVAHAFLMKAQQLAPDAMQLSAGKVQFDDISPKMKTYMELGQQKRKEWIVFIRKQQYNDTLERSFRSLT